MAKVIKILVFLFTYTATIFGSPLWRDSVSASFGHPNLPPIATDGKVLMDTTHVNGITSAMQKHLHKLRHPSYQSLFLTSPNLDPFRVLSTDLSTHSKLSHLLFRNSTEWLSLHSYPRGISEGHFICTFCPLLLGQTLPTDDERAQTLSSPTFKFNHKTHNEIAVKPPRTTCCQTKKILLICHLVNFSSPNLSAFSSAQCNESLSSHAMSNCLLFCLSRRDSSKTVSKNTQPYSYSTRQLFNHNPVELASYRNDRMFCSKQTWVSGLIRTLHFFYCFNFQLSCTCDSHLSPVS